MRPLSESIEQVARRFRIIGRDPRLMYALEVAVQVAPTDVPVLIVGESGVGKEVFAHVIHYYSPRREGPLLAINCGAIPEGTIDSELFGHEKGAFTSAVETRKGLFEVANGGTLFLDEIGEMPLGTQARLLRVLETGEYYRVGSSQVRKTDVRVVAATHRDLLELSRENRFREDLYYRLNTITISIPPLRERGEDILLLLDFFLDETSKKYRLPSVELTMDAERYLLDYYWPGNVRELKHFAERLVILHGGQTVDATMLEKLLPPRSARMPVLYQPSVRGGDGVPPPPPPDKDQLALLYHKVERIEEELLRLREMVQMLGQRLSTAAPSPALALPAAVTPPSGPDSPTDFSLENAEKRLITEALKRFQGNRKKAAQALGISERTLYRKIDLYGLHHL
jgi:DNA-binding NtrC family response regulator